jgi:hypothetical protein
MKPFRWSALKNEELSKGIGLSFEAVVVAVESGGLLDILAHPNQARYPRQRILVVDVDHYACLVPFVEEDEFFFLKTIIPSRKATKQYLTEDESDEEG